MASEIILVPVDAPAPAEPPPSESSDSGVVLPDEPVPAKRGRGRPPGAKNKAKSDVVEPPTPRNAKAPRVTRMPTPPQEDEEEDAAPLPPPVKKKPKRSPTALPRIEPEDVVEPSSPRSQRRKIHIDAQTRRHDHHTERVRGYSTLLDTMLAY
jgi:hypothetical protein